MWGGGGLCVKKTIPSRFFLYLNIHISEEHLDIKGKVLEFFIDMSSLIQRN